MTVTSLAIPEVKLVTPRRFGDERGYFSESYNARAFADAGIDRVFIQDNHSSSAKAGTVRGLHYQSPPMAQAKLLRVVKGRILDVAVDVRVGSPTYGEHVSAELSADNGVQIFVPEGFLHGFVTLEPDTHVLYKVNAYYDRECDGAVRFDDPALGIDWPVATGDVTLSDKDAAATSWAEFRSPFHYV
ncbi:dTDP-4-dehydrorhamnose 3,5-epimerase [Maricaulis sp.]|uniref:dTDP-4-dehydrorhamnose 3,5-epimerase n=1 Tax=Maricaulis sp. TaxID=1486257 RepID=UPI0025BD4C23|nr:dTDP-4-dehydrorhamnose 3,5-epimerase [Maricaulis sp.]